ncbi:Zinc finger protein [Oopsacas minuta]|uniref:Zinc finger protein n=1 Tax=Oopsacas minuta TaxID=111878 RepID=A0AAV7K1M5_9METZ|nr:Zinc finger protein [Oopsacas minuta]
MNRNYNREPYYEEDTAHTNPQREGRPFRESQAYRPYHPEPNRELSDELYSFYRQPPHEFYPNPTRPYHGYNHSSPNPAYHGTYYARESSRYQDYYQSGYRNDSHRPYRDSNQRDRDYNRYDRRPYIRENPYNPLHERLQNRNRFPSHRDNNHNYDNRDHDEHEPEHSPSFNKESIDRQTSDSFYRNWRQTTKPRSRCSSTSSKDDSIRSKDECVICYGTVKILALTPCEHSYCYLCCARLQILCEDNHCPICRTPFENRPVLLFQFNTPNPVYNELITNSRAIDNHKISLVRPLNRGIIDDLFELKCPIKDCPYIPPRNNMFPLEKHLKTEHEQNYCHECMYGLKLFFFEMRLYSKDELNRHKDGKGDPQLDPPGHQGHPMCKFCRKRFLDDSILYEHLHQNHFWCYICERNDAHVYYKSPQELRLHFKQEHFLCERGDCKQEIYTSTFASEIDFKAHISSVHAADLKKSEAKHLRRVDIEFHYASSNSDQGYRQRKQWRDRRPEPNNESDRLSDNEDNKHIEMNLETQESEFIFENSHQDVSNESLSINNSINIKSNDTQHEPNIRDTNPEYDNEPMKSPEDIPSDWPQISEAKPQSVNITNSHTNTNELRKQGDRNNPISYSQSLGISKQFKNTKQRKQQKQSLPASQPNKPVPFHYSDAVKPDPVKSHKNQSLSQIHKQSLLTHPPGLETKLPPSNYSDGLKPDSFIGNKKQSQLQKQSLPVNPPSQPNKPVPFHYPDAVKPDSVKSHKNQSLFNDPPGLETKQPSSSQFSDALKPDSVRTHKNQSRYQLQKQSLPINPSSQQSKPSHYSDAVKPDSIKTHKNQSQSQLHKQSLFIDPPGLETKQPPSSQFSDALKPDSVKTYRNQSELQEHSLPIDPPCLEAKAPSHYSDALKPDSVKTLTNQSQHQEPISEVSSAIPKTYEDVFPALSGNKNPVPIQAEKQPASVCHQTKNKKANKHRKKENNMTQPSIPQPPLMNISTSNTNDHKSSPLRTKQKELPQGDWATLLNENTEKSVPPINTQPDLRVQQQVPLTEKHFKDKKELNPSRARDVQPTLLPIVATYSQWQPPHNYQQRKIALENRIVSNFMVNSEMLEYFENYKKMIEKSLPVYEFLKYFKSTFNQNFSTILPAVLVLVPDIGLQQELLTAKELLFPSTPFLSFPSNTSSWSKQTNIELEFCPNCSQILLPSDYVYHKGLHSTEEEFPALF